jgi:glycosyltransferase involved in cell wall biosynthesis
MNLSDVPIRPLRILHTENSMAWGGQEIRILTEAKGLQDRGHDVRLLVCPGSPIGAAAARMGLPLNVVDFTHKSVRALHRLRRWLSLRGREFDVINTHSSTDSWLTAVACATLPGMPPIVRTRHVSTHVNRRRTTRWLYLAAASHIVTTGEALRQQLHRDNDFPLRQMTSVRTGIDLSRYRPRDRAVARRALGLADAPTIGVLATLRSWKGHDDLLAAFASLRHRFTEWRLLVIGDGPQRARLETMRTAMGLEDRVRIVGQVDNAEAWLPALDLFVLPSYGDEGVPQSIMQAMACGLAVVSTTVGAISEAVEDGRTGILVGPRGPDSLAAALAALMSDAARRKAMAAAGLERARSHFSIESMLDGMERVFDRAHSNADPRFVSGRPVLSTRAA